MFKLCGDTDDVDDDDDLSTFAKEPPERVTPSDEQARKAEAAEAADADDAEEEEEAEAAEDDLAKVILRREADKFVQKNAALAKHAFKAAIDGDGAVTTTHPRVFNASHGSSSSELAFVLRMLCAFL